MIWWIISYLQGISGWIVCKSTINIHLDLCAQCSSGKCGRILATHKNEWIRREQKIGLEYWIFIIWTTSAFYAFKFYFIVLNFSLWSPPSSSFAYYLFFGPFLLCIFLVLFVFLSAHQLVSLFWFSERQRANIIQTKVLWWYHSRFHALVAAHFN